MVTTGFQWLQLGSRGYILVAEATTGFRGHHWVPEATTGHNWVPEASALIQNHTFDSKLQLAFKPLTKAIMLGF